MFNSHLLSHQPQQQARPAIAKQKIPPIARPEIKQDVSDEEWNSFVQEWNQFKCCTDIPQGSEADHLFQCCERGLGRLVIRENSEIIAEGEESLLAAIKSMAVIKVATGVRRAALLATKQDHGESFREFYANVKAAASTCSFTVKCPHACCNDRPHVDYTSMVVKDVLISGVADTDIRKEVLGWSELDTKTDKEVVAFVEEKEVAKKAWTGSSVGATVLSGYRKGTKTVEDTNDPAIQKKLAMKGNARNAVPRSLSMFVCATVGKSTNLHS